MIEMLLSWLKDFFGFVNNKVVESDGGKPVERIPFDYIAAKLKDVVRQSKDVIGRKIIVPNTFIISFSPVDRAYRRFIEPVFIEELQEVVKKEIARIKGIVPEKKIDMVIETDKNLEAGRFYIDCFYREKKEKMKIKPHKFPKLQKLQESVTPESSELSKTVVPPPGDKTMIDGSFLKTLLEKAEKESEESSGSGLLFRIQLDEKRGSRSVYVAEGAFSIGRSLDADIQLDPEDKKISRNHLDLLISSEGITVKMLGKNGGSLNGKHVDSGVEFYAASGDKLYVGGAVLTLDICDYQGEKW